MNLRLEFDEVAPWILPNNWLSRACRHHTDHRVRLEEFMSIIVIGPASQPRDACVTSFPFFMAKSSGTRCNSHQIILNN
jgi:hypothetical protein